MKLTSTYLLVTTILCLPGISAAANKNPCNVECTDRRIAEALATLSSISETTWQTACLGTLSSGCNASCSGTSTASSACRQIIAATGADAQLAVGMSLPTELGVYIKLFTGTGKTDNFVHLVNSTSVPIRCGWYAASGMPVNMTNWSSSDSDIDTEMQPAMVEAAGNQNMIVAHEGPSSTNEGPAANYYLLCLGYDPTVSGAPNAAIPVSSITATWD